jgi:hypothetical protein
MKFLVKKIFTAKELSSSKLDKKFGNIQSDSKKYMKTFFKKKIYQCDLSFSGWSIQVLRFSIIIALQIILDLCVPEKELAKTRSQISFI